MSSWTLGPSFNMLQTFFICFLFPFQTSGLERKEIEPSSLDIQNDASWKYDMMLSHSRASPLIDFSSTEFLDFVVNSPRNYSTIVLFTKNSKSEQQNAGCPLCPPAHKIVNWIAEEYNQQSRRAGNQQPLFFVRALQERMPKLFRHFQIPSIPTLGHIPRHGKFANVQYIGGDGNKRARINHFYEVHKWIEKTAEIKIDVGQQSGNGFQGGQYLNWLIFGLCAYLYLFVWQKWTMEMFCERVFNRDYLCLVGMGILIMLISGHVYNAVQSPQFVMGSRDGGITFIYPARRVQLQAEAFIVSAIYIMFSAGFILLIEGRRHILFGLKPSASGKKGGRKASTKENGTVLSSKEQNKKDGTRTMTYGIVCSSVAYFCLLNVNFKKMG